MLCEADKKASPKLRNRFLIPRGQALEAGCGRAVLRRELQYMKAVLRGLETQRDELGNSYCQMEYVLDRYYAGVRVKLHEFE